MSKKVLIVFPGIWIKKDEGQKHRLNCHINEYKKAGFDVSTLAFCKDALFSTESKHLNSNAKWIIRPYILPITKCIIFTKILQFYMKTIVAIHSWIGNYDVIQVELWGLRSCFCKNRGVKYIVDVHGDVVHEAKEVKNLPQWYIDYCVKQQKEFVGNADICIVVSENLKKQLEINTGNRIKDYVAISCGVDINRFTDAFKPDYKEQNLENRIVLGYCGGLQKWQNFGQMVDLAIRLHKLDERIFLMVYSNGDPTDYQKKLDILGDENYFLKGLASKDVPGYLKLLDAGLLLRSDLILNKVSSPTKICEYLAAGVPMICTRHSGDYARSITNGINGFVADEPDFTEAEVKELLQWLLKVKANREEISSKCVKSVEDRTFEAEFNILANKLKE